MQNYLDIYCTNISTHNLKKISLKIPIGKWTTVTGVSGSGKSSLVFDTIHSESQRRFVETLGTYERQFLQGISEGEFEKIDNLPASIALKQSNRSTNPRSVIATATDLSLPLRILFLSLMDDSCTVCGNTVSIHKISDLLKNILNNSENKDYLFLVSLVPPKDSKLQKKLLSDLLAEGYTRLIVENSLVDIEHATVPLTMEDSIYIVLDRIQSSSDAEEIKNRIESLWSQVKYSPRFNQIILVNIQNKQINLKEKKYFNIQPFCTFCQKTTTIIEPSFLDWESIIGACVKCEGLGNIPIIDENKVIPNNNLSLKNGAIKAWNSPTFEWMNTDLLKALQKYNVDITKPYKELSEDIKELIWKGETKVKKKSFVSIQEFFQTFEKETYKPSSRILLFKYRKYILCPSCSGSRISAKGRNAKCHGIYFHELFNQEIHYAKKWLDSLKKENVFQKKLESLSEIYSEVDKKITLLIRLGLGSATLFRRCRTLSGGEYQRVLLTRVVGNGLSDCLYILDEPSIGLGANEINEITQCLQELKTNGNTILVVDHDRTMIKSSDLIYELGPGGGKEGGHLLTFNDNKPNSLNSKINYPKINNFKHIESQTKKSSKLFKNLFLEDFSLFNCRHLNLEIFLGQLNLITGPSGSGKTTILNGLRIALEKYEDFQIKFNLTVDTDNNVGTWKSLELPENYLQDYALIHVDQSAGTRSIASIPATLLGTMDTLRKKFSQVLDVKNDGLTASHFSFNGEGACPHCDGKGFIEEDLFFLGSSQKSCPECSGNRYKKDILKYTWNGKNICEWLSTTIKESLTILAKQTGFSKPLALAVELGLGHLPLGIPTSQVSGGELQRLKIVSALVKSDKKMLCFLDEPSRGLSDFDVGNLIESLIRLTLSGHTFIIAEHHHLFEHYSPHIMEIGPKSGKEGGQIVKRKIMQ